MSSFSLDISKFQAKTEAGLAALIRGVVIGLAERIDERSPVGDATYWKTKYPPAGYLGGHFRANNQYKFGAAPKNEIDGVDGSGSATMSAIIAGVKAAPALGVHYIANNTPYAQALENGHSGQAPKGVFLLAALDMQNIVNAESAKMRAK